MCVFFLNKHVHEYWADEVVQANFASSYLLTCMHACAECHARMHDTSTFDRSKRPLGSPFMNPAINQNMHAYICTAAVQPTSRSCLADFLRVKFTGILYGVSDTPRSVF